MLLGSWSFACPAETTQYVNSPAVCPFWWLYCVCQTCFEMAVLSCKEPFLIHHKDKVVLSPKPSFLPKVISTFNLEDIVFLPLCPAQKALQKITLRCLCIVTVYLTVSSSIWKIYFIIVNASKSSIAGWLTQLIVRAYALKDEVF